MNTISNIIVPNRLLLVWQPLEEHLSRTRRVVGELYRSAQGVGFRYLTDTEDFREAKKVGFECFPAFPDLVVNYGDVLDVFITRLPPRSRNDFGEYLLAHRLPRNIEIDDFTLLGYTEARVPGDGFSIIHPFDGAPAPCQFLSEIAGYRHYHQDNGTNLIGKTLTFEVEHTNPHDPDAIMVLAEGILIGYVNRIQKEVFHQWLQHRNLRAVVERKNGRPGKPRVLMFVDVC
jgi:hypothetical protein